MTYRLTLTPDGLATPLGEWLRRLDELPDGPDAIEALLSGYRLVCVSEREADAIRKTFDGLVLVEPAP
jgi:hypothetical protein